MLWVPHEHVADASDLILPFYVLLRIFGEKKENLNIDDIRARIRVMTLAEGYDKHYNKFQSKS